MNLRLPLLLLLSLHLATSAIRAASTAEAEVLSTERQRVAALVKNDLAALDRLLADDLTYTHSSALVETKAEYLSAIRSGKLKYHSLDHEQQRVRLYGDTAVLTGITKVFSTYHGKEGRPTLRFTIVYVKRAGRWQMVAWQSTGVP